MGKTKIRITPQALERFLQFPEDWRIVDAGMRPLEFNPHTLEMFVTVEGPTVEDDKEYQGIFTSRIFEDQDGRWNQGRWEMAPIYYGSLEDVRRTFNQPQQQSEREN